jgi:hypothetical protein
VDSEGAAEILGVTPQYIGRLAAQGEAPVASHWALGRATHAGVPACSNRGNRAGTCEGIDTYTQNDSA